MTMDNAPPQDAPLSMTRKALLVVWAIVALWLVLSLLVSVISALFFGGGPLDETPPEAATIEAAPDAPTAPGS